jgi:hypothetical protein
MRTDVERERAALAFAEREIEENEERFARQMSNIAAIRAGGRETRRSERLLALIQATIFDWRLHRAAIRQRIAHLEAQGRREGR